MIVLNSLGYHRMLDFACCCLYLKILKLFVNFKEEQREEYLFGGKNF